MRRGRTIQSIEKPLWAPIHGSPGSLRYATTASVAARTNRTIVAGSSAARIAAPLTESRPRTLLHRGWPRRGCDALPEGAGRIRGGQAEAARSRRRRQLRMFVQSTGLVQTAAAPAFHDQAL